MKTRRHHNNEGTRQIHRGKTRDQVKAIARKLGLPSLARVIYPPTLKVRITDPAAESGKSLTYVRADLVRRAMPSNWADDDDTLALARALGMDARAKDRP